MLNQNDFRKLLATGGKDADAEKKKKEKEAAAAGGKGAGGKGGGDKKEKRKRSYQEYLAKKELHKAAHEKPQYRDRAAERQQGKLLDYAGTAEVLKNISVEHSKFLGGDEAHTHLVKGLDYALLERARSKLQADLQQIQHPAAKKAESARNPGARLTLDNVDELLSVGAGDDDPGAEPKFNTTMGYAIYRMMVARRLDSGGRSSRSTTAAAGRGGGTKGAAAAASRAQKKSSPFAVGHMSFEYPLDPTRETLPTKVLHSKAEVAGQEQVVHHAVPPALFDEIERFALKRRGMKKKSKRHKKHHHHHHHSPTASGGGGGGAGGGVGGTAAAAPGSAAAAAPPAVHEALDPDVDMFAL